LPDGEGQPVAPSFSELAGRAHYSASDLADIMDDPQHMGAIAAKDLSLDALASYLNQIDR
jgi:hypothetical protein